MNKVVSSTVRSTLLDELLERLRVEDNFLCEYASQLEMKLNHIRDTREPIADSKDCEESPEFDFETRINRLIRSVQRSRLSIFESIEKLNSII